MCKLNERRLISGNLHALDPWQVFDHIGGTGTGGQVPCTSCQNLAD